MSELDLMQEIEREERLVQVFRIGTFVSFIVLIVCFILALKFKQFFGALMAADVICLFVAVIFSSLWDSSEMEVLFLLEEVALEVGQEEDVCD